MKEKLQGILQTAKEQLGVLHDKALAEAGEDAAMLFEAHQMMLDDLDFVESIEGLIENDRLNAEAAVSDTGAQFAEMFAAMDDSYMQARAADIRDISARVIGILTGEGESGIVSDVPCIVAADDLAPSETVQLDKSLILGFITAGGSANSHTAILARTMGIPAIISAGDALQPEMEGKYAIIDGQTGEAVIEPDDAERERLLKKQAKEKALKELLDQLKGKPNVTKDGRNVMVYCNIGSPADIDAVLQNDGGGIGLFRSEFLYLQGSDYPTEDEQFEAYKTVAEKMEGKPVIIRTLDIGGDKEIPYMGLEKDENPFLGYRAIRFCLDRKDDVYRPQLRALLRASAYGNIRIMIPMVTCLDEYREAKALIEEMKPLLSKTKWCEMVLCVPFTDIQAAVKAAKGSKIAIGAENMHFEKSGAFTGEISADMLKELGVKYVIIGHSERRQYFNETDEACGKKVQVALENGLRPILCVGESLTEREQDVTMEVIRKQIKIALQNVAVEDIKKVVIAYEPIWAIGTGKTATAEQANEVCSAIRDCLREKYGARAARGITIQYGGSMNAKNASELLAQPDVDGGLIGGASLKSADFATIVEAANQ